MTSVPPIRIRPVNSKELNPSGDYVLYWMTAFRRLGWNFALQHADDLARSMGKPLVILEALFLDYPYASPRFHRFILDGMAERSRALRGFPVTHYPFVERESGESRGLLKSLADKACCVVADDFPSFFLPKLVEAGGRRVGVRLEAVDSNGLLPLSVAGRTFSAAYHFRRFLQKNLPDHLGGLPEPDPFSRPMPLVSGGAGAGMAAELDPLILDRWPPTTEVLLSGDLGELQALTADQSVPAVEAKGGTLPAHDRLSAFLGGVLHRYHNDRNHPDLRATSGLSPYLHFGDISSHEIFAEVARREGWTPVRLSSRADGSRSGWWGMGDGAEAFLDQLITWRELGFNMTHRRDDYAGYDSLPGWAQDTLAVHQGDPRPHLYSLEEFLEAETHDPLWNAAQRQLRKEGVIHNYLRMLWGKKILEWSRTPKEALDVMIDLNDRFALDGRDPNSYSGIFWCFGRYDRGWTERPVFGKVRSMSSHRTRKKVRLEEYLQRFGPS